MHYLDKFKPRNPRLFFLSRKRNTKSRKALFISTPARNFEEVVAQARDVKILKKILSWKGGEKNG